MIPLRLPQLLGPPMKLEHYEIAAYGTVRKFAEILGEDALDAALLEQTLEEEKNADVMLTEMAESANTRADKAALHLCLLIRDRAHEWDFIREQNFCAREAPSNQSVQKLT